jgi:hypothetical protein
MDDKTSILLSIFDDFIDDNGCIMWYYDAKWDQSIGSSFKKEWEES